MMWIDGTLYPEPEPPAALETLAERVPVQALGRESIRLGSAAGLGKVSLYLWKS